jgi:hypothetical protein
MISWQIWKTVRREEPASKNRFDNRHSCRGEAFINREKFISAYLDECFAPANSY